MPIQMQCPHCQAVAALPDGHAGRPVRCKRCGATFAVPPDAGAKPGQPALIDRYLVRELLGAGTFGSVYRAFDPRLERDVALKVLRPEMMSSAHAVERFLREAKAAAKLLHPHVVPVYDAGRSGEVYYIASAFIKGMTLASAVPEEGGMEARRAAELTAQLASALGYAHRQGVLHRDVKPANAMLDEQGQLHLMDFGLAGWTQDESTRLTRLGAVMGTPAYMAPEQATGDTTRVGPASDLYSAGVVLYELLTSRLPFEAGHPAAWVYLMIHTEPPPPSQHRPGLDMGLEALCLKAMAKRPEDRFASGEEMAAALAKWAPMALPLAQPMDTAPPGAHPAKPTAPAIVRSKATIARPAPASDKESILPSPVRSPAPPSKAATARRPSVFARETVAPAASKRSTLGSSPAAKARTGSRQGRRTDIRRNLVLWGGIGLAVVAVLAVAAAVVCLFPPHRQPPPPSAEAKPDLRPVDPTPDNPHDNPPPPAETTTAGEAVGVDKDQLTFAADGGQRTVTVPADAKVRIDGKDAILDEIQKGGAVAVTSRGDVVIKVEVRNPPPPPPEVTVAGTVVGAEKGRLTAAVDGKEKTYAIPDTAQVLIDDKDGKVEDIKKDSTLTVTLKGEVITKVKAKSPAVPPPPPANVDRVTGKVVGVDEDKLTVSVDEKEQTFTIPATAKVTMDAKDGNLADVKKDSGVTITTKDKVVVTVEAKSPSPARAEAPFDAVEAKRLQQAWADYLGVPVVREVNLGGGVTMKLVLIPPGSFRMGSPKDEAGHHDDEGPQHEVELARPFYLGTCPVTRGQFAAFVKDDDYRTEAEKAGEQSTWGNPFTQYNQADDDPVVDVSWNDAVRFCQWLSRKAEGKTYELPTEAEWEYACRAGTTTAFSFGDDPKNLGDYAWYGDNSGPHTHPVGGKKPNSWGLYDMHGNAWQWCADGYGPYQEGYIKDPKGQEGGRRVLRGGSWVVGSRGCRSADRYVYDPGVRSVYGGFRVVLRVPARTP